MKLKNKIGYFFKELDDEIDGIIRDVKEFMSAFYFVDWYDDKKFLSTGWFILIAGLGLQLNDKKPLFSAISKKARFINTIELLKDKHLLPFSF
jgi:hypothetical protein